MSAIKDRRGLGFQHYATDATGKRLGSVYLCVCVCVCVCVCFFRYVSFSFPHIVRV